MKTMKDMNFKILMMFPTLVILGALSGCGDSKSNPLEKYKGLDTVPANNNKPATQARINDGLFTIQVEGPNEINIANFTEGQESEVKFKVSSNSLAISRFAVKLSAFGNMTPPELLETGVPGEYSIKWMPPLGTLPGNTTSQSFAGQIQVGVVETTDERLKPVVGIKDFTVTVSRNNSQPTILGKSDLKTGIDEGQPTDFTVDVSDPAVMANDLRIPDVQRISYVNSNTESFRADGANYLVLDDRRKNNPERLSKNAFRFHYIIKADQLPFDRDRVGKDMPSSPDVTMCFYIRAVSIINTMSDKSLVCTKARYAAQPPTVVFENAMPTEIKAGQPVSLHFKVSADQSMTVVSISKPASLISSLSGKKEITCDFESPTKKNSQVCVIQWTPACLTTMTPFTISVKGDGTLGNKTKSASASKTINVAPSDDCVVPPPPEKVKKPMAKTTKKVTK